jgi:hypothetical protein
MNSPSVSFLRSRIILLFIPAVVLWFCYLYYKQISDFFVFGHDPVYPYLLNATNLASGHSELGLFEHPGTPVSVFGGLLIFIRHLFSGGLPIYQQVIQNPESYLHMLCLAFIITLGLVTFFTGLYVYRKTGNLAVALFFQLAPLLGPYMLQHAILFKPESLLVSVITFFSAYLYVQVIGTDGTPGRLTDRSILLSAVLLGLLIATKIICAPLVIIIYLLLRNFRQVLLFTLSLGLSFLLFILPLIPKYRDLWIWFTNLLNHDGHYGTGKEQIINKAEFLSSLGKIFNGDLFFTATYLLLTCAFLVALVRFIIKKSIDRILVRFITGLWVSFTLLILMVAKHFSFHYLISGMTFFPLYILISFRVFNGYRNLDFYKRFQQVISYCLVGLIFSSFLLREGKGLFAQSAYRIATSDTRSFMASRQGMPVITMSHDHSAFIYPSLWFGIIYSGNLRNQYFEYTKKYYPNWYMYHTENHKLLNWDEEEQATDLLRKHPKVLVYFIEQDSLEEQNILKGFCRTDKGKTVASFKKLYRNNPTQETFYLMEADTTQLAKSIVAKTVISSDLEKMNAEHTEFLSNDVQHNFKKAGQVSSHEYRSGLNSILLNVDNPYGLDMEFDVEPGDFIEASVWRKSSDNDGGIIISAKEISQFYAAGSSICNTSGDWIQIRCRARVPLDFTGRKLTFYLYYTGKKNAYFDDVNIAVYPGE